VGGLWDWGHTIALFVIGAIVIFLKVQISETAETRLEALVGVMLILLGSNAIRKLYSAKTVHVHKHEHDGPRTYTHSLSRSGFGNLAPSIQSEVDLDRHGPRLAGSAALMLLILPVIPSPRSPALYTYLWDRIDRGMMAMSFLIGLPFHFTAGRFKALNGAIRLTAGVFSLCLGGWIVYEKLSV
jgi:hypothetical protein